MNLKNDPAGILDNEGREFSIGVPEGFEPSFWTQHNKRTCQKGEKESVNSGTQEARLTWLSIFNTSSCGSPSYSQK